MDNQGNVKIRGKLYQSQSMLNRTSAKEWIVEDYSENPVAILNLETGDLNLKGALTDEMSSITPGAGSEFIIKNENNIPVLLIDSFGNMKILGEVYQYANP